MAAWECECVVGPIVTAAALTGGRAAGLEQDSLLKQWLVLSGLRCTAQARDLSTRGRSWSVSFWSMLAAVRCAYVLTFCRTPATTSIPSGATGSSVKTASAEMVFLQQPANLRVVEVQ